MNLPLLHCLLGTAILATAALATTAREWTDSTGHYKINADLIAFNEERVVIQREDKELASVPIEQLSEQDREFLKSKEAEGIANRTTDAMQTWTLADGIKVVGRVVDYARREVTLQRRRGKIYVNDRHIENLPEIYQRMIPKIVAHFENIRPDNLEAWLVRQKGQPRTFTVEGVILELENGDEYAVPFFFFSEKDLALLKPGWNRWLEAHTNEDYVQRDDEAFLLQSLASAAHRDREVDRQIALMQLNMQAALVGLTSFWEVTLYPSRGNFGPPLWVVIPARDSLQATRNALQQKPGYVAGPVRRVGG